MNKRLIIFICTGNICRSPMAEYLLRYYLGKKSGWKVSSAGVMAGYGIPASQPGIEVLKKRHIDMNPHRSQPLTRELVDKATLILVMTVAHLEQIRILFPDVMEKVFLMKSFNSSCTEKDVDDPIGASFQVYNNICNEIDASIPGLITFMKELKTNPDIK